MRIAVLGTDIPFTETTNIFPKNTTLIISYENSPINESLEIYADAKLIPIMWVKNVWTKNNEISLVVYKKMVDLADTVLIQDTLIGTDEEEYTQNYAEKKDKRYDYIFVKAGMVDYEEGN